MSTATATATIPFEQKILDTLDGCMEKMSIRLNASFKPEDKDSISLFRQLCAAMRTRVQWIKNAFAPDAQPTPLKKIFTPESVAPKVDVEKLKKQPGHLDVIAETLKNYPKVNENLIKTCKAPGLLMKR